MNKRNKIIKATLIWIGVLFGSIALVMGITTLAAWMMIRGAGNIKDYSSTKWQSSGPVIAHALGGIDDIDYTNSLEALESNYRNGTRIFEVDFLLTSDNELACCHDFDTIMQSGVSNTSRPTLESFLANPVYEKYTALSAKDILTWMSEHPDAYMITDTKDDLSTVINVLVEDAYELSVGNETKTSALSAEMNDVLNRTIVQIYNEEDDVKVREIHYFEHMIFTLYMRGFEKTAEDFEDVSAYCKNHNIDAITMWASWWNPDYAQIKENYNVGVYVHTVNDLEQALSMKNAGVDGFYTDYILNSDFE